MKYIDSEKLIAEIKYRIKLNKEMLEIDGRPSDWGRIQEGLYILRFIERIQQEQPHFADADKTSNLEHWLAFFGMPKENIDNCITQIAQGYGACRYLEGIQHGAEAVNELAKQEQPEVNLEKEIKNYLATKCAGDDEPSVSEIASHFYELGLNTRKEETK